MESNIQRHRPPSRRGSRKRARKAPLMKNVIVGKEEGNGAMADNINELGRVSGGEGERSKTGESQLPLLPEVPDELRAGGSSELAQQVTMAGQERVAKLTEAATLDGLAAMQERVEVGEKNVKKKRPRTQRESDEESDGGDERSVNWKPDPFPPTIPTMEKKRRWREWKAQFVAMMELRGEKRQQRKALMLYTSVGPEVRRVIDQGKMMAPTKEDEGGQPFFDVMLKRLDEYFDKFSDGGVEVRIFHDMKQDATESAHEFYQRLMEQADICGFTGVDQLVRVRLIDGLRDKVVTEHAHMANLPSAEIVGMAARNEAKRAAAIVQPTKPGPRAEALREEDIAAIAAAVQGKMKGKSGGYSERYRPYGAEDRRARERDAAKTRERPRERSRERSRGRQRAGPSNERPRKDGDGSRRKPDGEGKRQGSRECPRCRDRFTHRTDESCPAKGMRCFKCRGTGHMAAACKERDGAYAVEYDKDAKEEVDEKWMS